MIDIIMEIIAYIATAIVLISFMLKDVRTLRLLNTIGCFLFLIYGVYHQTLPIAFLNASIMIVNIYYLIRKS